jgi:RNAse (barnase) inhibitor barstar
MEAMKKQLADVQKCGVYQLVGRSEEVEHAAKEAGLAIFRMDIGHTRDKKDFLAHIAKALSFPDWFGGNWDALNDCLADLDWLSTKTGYVLVFEKSEHFAASHKQEFDDATAVLAATAEYWKSHGRPFWALVAASEGWDCGLPKWPTW